MKNANGGGGGPALDDVSYTVLGFAASAECYHLHVGITASGRTRQSKSAMPSSTARAHA